MWITKECLMLILALVAVLSISSQAWQLDYWTSEDSEPCTANECVLNYKDDCLRPPNNWTKNPCSRRKFCESPPNSLGKIRDGPPKAHRGHTWAQYQWLAAWRYCLDIHRVNIKEHVRRLEWENYCQKYSSKNWDTLYVKSRACCVFTDLCDIPVITRTEYECQEVPPCLGYAQMEGRCCDYNKIGCSSKPCGPEDMEENPNVYPWSCFDTDRCITPFHYGWCCEMYQICNRTICEEEPITENFFLDYYY